jgi:hypothetical protein
MANLTPMQIVWYGCAQMLNNTHHRLGIQKRSQSVVKHARIAAPRVSVTRLKKVLN